MNEAAHPRRTGRCFVERKSLFGQSVLPDIGENLLAQGLGRDVLPQHQQVGVADLPAQESVGQVAVGADAVPCLLYTSDAADEQ